MVVPSCEKCRLINMMGIHRGKKRKGKTWLPGREQQRGLKGKYETEKDSLAEFLKDKVWH